MSGARPAPEPRQAPRAAALPTRAARRDAARVPWGRRVDDAWTMLLGYGYAALAPLLLALVAGVRGAIRSQVGVGRHARPAHARSIYAAPALAVGTVVVAEALWILAVR